MIAPKPTREVIADLKAAGWTKVRQVGSHGRWACPTGTHKVTSVDGHRTTSPTVVRAIYKAMTNCDCEQEDNQ